MEVLPGLGARLGRYPRVAAAVLALLRGLPGRRLRSLASRRVAEPLVRRMDADLVVRVPGGRRMRVRTGDVTGRMLATSGVWEPHVTGIFRRALRPGDVCADVGAHLGYYSLVAAALVGPTGRVHAFEPAHETFAQLQANLRLNRAENVTAHRVAVGAAETEELLFDPMPGFGSGARSFRRRPAEPADATRMRAPVTVAVRPLAAVLPESELPRLRLVKVDVEGYEAEALAGLEPVLERGHRPAIVVEIHPSIVADAPARVAEFCERHALEARRIADPAGADRRWTLAHPALEPLPLGELAAATDPLLEVLLTAQEPGSRQPPVSPL